MKYIDLFAGIGGFAQAAKAYNMQCVFASEIDKYARITYEANHGHVPAGDITKIHAADIPDHDLLMAGFPCQAFSVAGKRLGFEDTRGTLFFEIARILKHKQPAMFLLENVKGLKSHDQGRTMQTILDTLESLGYQVHWKILNAKDYGVPQNRERIFFVGFKQPREFVWPEKQEKVTLSQVLEGNFEREIGYTVRSSGRGSGIGDKHNWDTYNVTIMSDLRNGNNTIHSWDLIETSPREKQICHLILQNRRSKKYGTKDGNPMSLAHLQELDSTVTEAELQELVNKKILVYEQGLYEFVNSKQSAGINGIYRVYPDTVDAYGTLTAMRSRDYIVKNQTIRKLTPRECARLQGFPDNFVIPVSNTQAYKQFGNAVCVKVVEALLGQMVCKSQ